MKNKGEGELRVSISETRLEILKDGISDRMPSASNLSSRELLIYANLLSVAEGDLKFAIELLKKSEGEEEKDGE